MRHPHHVTICCAVALATGLWGLYWIPQRELEAAGLTGGWGTLAQYVIPLVLVAPVMAWRASKGRPTGATWCLIGTLTGGGIVCYANSFLLTEVVRALMLFYMAPVWATLLERFAMRRAVARSRYLTLALALGGLWIVFGQDGDPPLPRNAGDWLALAGGAMIAAGAARVNAVQPDSPWPILFSFYVYGTAFAAVVCWLLRAELGPVPAAGDLVAMLPFLLLLVVFLLIPTNALLIWSPAKIGAGVFSILMLSEIVTGAVSAALLADERFGWREALGCGLIVAAGAIEIVASGRKNASEPR